MPPLRVDFLECFLCDFAECFLGDFAECFLGDFLGVDFPTTYSGSLPLLIFFQRAAATLMPSFGCFPAFFAALISVLTNKRQSIGFGTHIV